MSVYKQDGPDGVHAYDSAAALSAVRGGAALLR
jgi:hypothetical protein